MFVPKREGAEPLPYGKSLGFVVAIYRNRGVWVFYVNVTYRAFTYVGICRGWRPRHPAKLPPSRLRRATSLSEGGLGCVASQPAGGGFDHRYFTSYKHNPLQYKNRKEGNCLQNANLAVLSFVLILFQTNNPAIRSAPQTALPIQYL